nr:MAG TPA: PD-(D/E)XK nuclease superfamily protein [Caudoviricetes sp.]
MKLKSKNTSGSNHEHALLSPSSAKKWLGCPAALACEFGLPNESGQAAINGTVMHLVAETVLNRVIKGDDITADKYKGVYALNEGKGPIKAMVKPEKGAVLITDDFMSQVNKYVDYCRPIIDAAELVEVESRVNLTRVLHPGVSIKQMVYPPNAEPYESESTLQTFGTADLVAIVKNTDGTYTLIVGDLKTGRHKVLAKENKQMMLYALGLLRVYKRLYDITAVRLVIFQPYAGGADEWDTTPEALEQFGKFASKAALKAIDAFQRGKKGLKPADFRPGNSACEWCRFSEKCSARSKSAAKTVESDLSDEIEMTDEQIVAEYLKLDVMRQHISDIEKAMYKLLINKGATGGFKLVAGRPGNRAWTDQELVIKTFGDKVMKEVVMTPTDALKVLPEEELEQFITRKDGQPSIATIDDKRPEWRSVGDDDLSD